MSNKFKILFVEKDPKVVETFSSILADRGYHSIITISDPDACVRLFPFVNADVLLVGVPLNTAENQSFAAFLRTQKKKAASTIILLVENAADARLLALSHYIFNKYRDVSKLLYIIAKIEIVRPVLENRLFKRLPKHGAIRVFPESNGVDRVVNLSPAGMGFESRFSFTVGAKLKINVSAWGKKSYEPRMDTILWKDYGTPGYRYGLRFEEPLLPNGK